MSDPSEQRQVAPPYKETKYANTPFIVGDLDPNTNTRELTFVVAPLEGITFVIGEEGAKALVESFSGGITIAQPGDIPDA